MSTTNEKTPRRGNAEGVKGVQADRTTPSVAPGTGAPAACTAPEVIVWDCACGYIHRYAALTASGVDALGERCKPHRAEVRR